MPGYIGFTPQFNPISLQDYLTVPMMILEGRQKEADKIEQYQNEAEKWRTLMGDSPEAQAIWKVYDDALSNLGDNLMSNRTGDLARAARSVGNSFRSIKYAAEDAKKRQDADVERFANNPSLIGSPADFMTYYNQSGYRAPAIDSKELATSIGSVVATEAAGRPNRYLDNDPQSGLDRYIKGITPTEIDASIQNAVAGTPNDNISNGIRQYLDNIGYENLSPELQNKVLENIYKSARANSGIGIDYIDPLKRKAQEAQIEASKASAALHWTQNRIAKDQLPQEWDDLSETTPNNKHYKYRQRKDSAGRIFIERSPLIKNNKGQWVPEKGNNWWQPAPYYMRDGVTYNESLSGTGLYGGTQTSSIYPQDNTQISYIYDDKSNKLSAVAPDAATVLDDLENYPEINPDKKDQVEKASKAKNYLTNEGYDASQYQLRWDKKNKQVIMITTGQPKPKLTAKQAWDAYIAQQNSNNPTSTMFGSAFYNVE